jgi:uncharacterized protein YdeI (YjbR/CyaY-like superfamily)
MDFASGALFTIGCTAIINYRNVLKTMKGPTNPLEFEDRDQWRSWLEVNHATKREAWLLIYKKKYQELGLALYEAVEEALCFGWIDGTLSPLDERRYALRFSPRTKNSIWSMRNIQRVEKLMADGKMTDAGMLKVAEAKANGEWEAALRREQVDSLPQDLEKALRKREGGLSAYQALPASRKKLYIYWLQSAKREETKQRRIQKIVEEVLNQ